MAARSAGESKRRPCVMAWFPPSGPDQMLCPSPRNMKNARGWLTDRSALESLSRKLAFERGQDAWKRFSPRGRSGRSKGASRSRHRDQPTVVADHDRVTDPFLAYERLDSRPPIFVH